MRSLSMLILILVFSSLASADPGPATRYLISEPATLMDVGLFRAELALAKFDRVVTDAYQTAYKNRIDIGSTLGYDFESDLFQLSVWVYYAPMPKSTCESVLEKYGRKLRFMVPGWFAHQGHTTTRRPDSLSEKLRSRVELHCFAGEEDSETVRGKRMLHDDEIIWTADDDD